MGWIVPLFRFVKHLLATNVDGIEFLLQSSAWSRKTRYANPQDICLSFFFWFISSYIILETIPAPGKQRRAMDSFFLFSIIKNMATYCKTIYILWHTGVNVCVFLHIRLLVEPLAAVLAGVRPRVRVDEQVRGEGGGALEWFAAHLALKAFFLIKGKSAKPCYTIINKKSRMPEKLTFKFYFLAKKIFSLPCSFFFLNTKFVAQLLNQHGQGILIQSSTTTTTKLTLWWDYYLWKALYSVIHNKT